MAKTISDEQMKLTMIINGNAAQKELLDLEKSTRALNEQNKLLLIEKKKLEKQGQKDSEQYKQLTATIKQNTAEINANKNKMAELQKEIGLTGLTMAQLQSKATMLRNTLRNMVPGSQDYQRYQAELTQVNNRLDELRGRSQTARSSIGSLADSFNRYQGIAVAAVAALTGVALTIDKIIDINGKLSDAQSDVMKTTGMTKVEVDELTKSFGLLQTRTSRIDLLGIAEQGGRIGIAKEEIGDFVNVMNKAAVALGDSFTGGAEEVSNKLGKIKFLFEQTKDLNVDESYNAIGSAINDLGANGVASENNIAEFTTRIGSLTDVLKPTIQETLALGAAFEESGIEAEVSSRAYSIFMNRASTESGKFAKVMGITQVEVEKMINTNPLEFMLKFAEGMKGMDATKTSKTLDYLGISADGANKVIGAMGNNTARFRELIDLSNTSFATGTSLINEYNVKNTNLAAVLEKLGKTISGWFSSETFVKWLTGAVDWLARFVGATEDADGSVTAWRNTLVFIAKVLAIVTAAMLTNVGWQKLVVLWTTRSAEANILYTIAAKARAFADGVATLSTQALVLAQNILAFNLKGTAQAFRAMTATMMTTPWGFIIGAIAAIGTAYLMFRKNADEASKTQKVLSDVHLEASKNIAKEKLEIELYTKIAQDQNRTEAERIKAINKLNEIIPDHIGNLTLENIKTAEGISILQKYTAELYANARAKAVQSKFDELAKERVDIENKTSKNYQSSTGQFLSTITGQDNSLEFKNRKEVEQYVLKTFSKSLNTRKDKVTGVTLVNKEMYETLVNKYMDDYGINEKEKELASKDSQMKALEAELLKNTVKDITKGKEETTLTNYNTPSGDKAGSKGTKKKYDDSYINDELRLREELYNARKKSEEDRIALMQEGYEKSLAIEKLNSQSKIQELNFQSDAVKSLQTKLDKELIAAQKANDPKKIESIKNQKELLIEKEKELNEQRITEEKLHQLRVGTIEEKAAKDQLEKAKLAFDQAKVLRETKYNEQLAALGNNERAKEKLKKEFELQELAEEEKFLNELIAKFNTIVGKGKFDGIDLSLLTPEQVAQFTAEAEKIGLTLAELIAKKNALAGKGTDFSILQGQGTDILGFSPEQWESAFSNFDTLEEKIQAATVVFGGLQNAWSMYSSFVEVNSRKELQTLDKKQTAERAKLKKQLDHKQISQAAYDKKIAKLDQDKEKAQAEAEYKRAKMERTGALLSIATNTAIGVMKAVAASPLTGGLPWSAIIGGMGLLQAAMVLKNPLPAKGHEEGLYPEYVKRTQDGKTFRSRYGGKTRSGLVSDTSHFLVAENGPEMVIDNKAWRQMDPAVKDALVRNLQGIKGFEQGLYNQETMRYEVPATATAPATSANDAQLLQMVLAVVQENTATMKYLQENGVYVTNKDLKSMKNLKEGIQDYEKLRNKAKN